jgi:hypothetical protein
VELDFCGITGIGVFAFGTLLLAKSFVQDQVSASSCDVDYFAHSSAVKDLEYVATMCDFCSVIFVFFLMMLQEHHPGAPS